MHVCEYNYKLATHFLHFAEKYYIHHQHESLTHSIVCWLHTPVNCCPKTFLPPPGLHFAG